jgi:hypothetical protein
VCEIGVLGLYRGVGPKLAQSALTAALLFAAKVVKRLNYYSRRLLTIPVSPHRNASIR